MNGWLCFYHQWQVRLATTKKEPCVNTAPCKRDVSALFGIGQVLVLTLSPVSSAVEAANEITRRFPEALSDAARTLYSALVAVSVETARRRDYSPNTTHVTFHCPVEQVARACGISRQTAWRHLPALRELGVLDYRTHKGSLHGETRNSGTLWQVRLNPIHGSRARLSFDDLKHKWRDLEADYKRYRLSSLTLKRQLETYTKNSPNIELILVWAVPSKPDTSPGPSYICMFQISRVRARRCFCSQRGP